MTGTTDPGSNLRALEGRLQTRRRNVSGYVPDQVALWGAEERCAAVALARGARDYSEWRVFLEMTGLLAESADDDVRSLIEDSAVTFPVDPVPNRGLDTRDF